MLLAKVPIPGYSQITHTRSCKSMQSPARPLQHIHTAQVLVLSKAEPVQLIWVRFPTGNLQPCCLGGSGQLQELTGLSLALSLHSKAKGQQGLRLKSWAQIWSHRNSIQCNSSNLNRVTPEVTEWGHSLCKQETREIRIRWGLTQNACIIFLSTSILTEIPQISQFPPLAAPQVAWITLWTHTHCILFQQHRQA